MAIVAKARDKGDIVAEEHHHHDTFQSLLEKIGDTGREPGSRLRATRGLG